MLFETGWHFIWDACSHANLLWCSDLAKQVLVSFLDFRIFCRQLHDPCYTKTGSDATNTILLSHTKLPVGFIAQLPAKLPLVWQRLLNIFSMIPLTYFYLALPPFLTPTFPGILSSSSCNRYTWEAGIPKYLTANKKNI